MDATIFALPWSWNESIQTTLYYKSSDEGGEKRAVKTFSGREDLRL